MNLNTDIRITIKKNASAKIEFPKAELILPDGSSQIIEGILFICRCGKSEKNPFCDGAHKSCPFE